MELEAGHALFTLHGATSAVDEGGKMSAPGVQNEVSSTRLRRLVETLWVDVLPPPSWEALASFRVGAAASGGANEVVDLLGSNG